MVIMAGSVLSEDLPLVTSVAGIAQLIGTLILLPTVGFLVRQFPDIVRSMATIASELKAVKENVNRLMDSATGSDRRADHDERPADPLDDVIRRKSRRGQRS